ncbi:MAG: guanylate kinase [Thermoleophilia bacterium]|nr:guanylate kinase [Thermoleophilia bacterium]
MNLTDASSRSDEKGNPAFSKTPGRLIVIAGPSGVGKGTLINAVLPRLPGALLATSATTRPMRPGEQQGREYHFLSPGEFEERVNKEEFLEHVSYGSHRYGTLKSEVDGHLKAGRQVLLEIEVEGARKVRRRVPGALMVFIAPPSLEELERRLTGRDTEDEVEISSRMERARKELAARPEFDYIVINQDVDQAADELERIIRTNLQGGQT